ncbi:hypothetical protein Sjap_004746 [Stephania japonica]|uniref:Uncharacterized protein n=1 Tax=Stephania japonica TaxID=461633 RepID=A0AAP0K4A9_9MAGN
MNRVGCWAGAFRLSSFADEEGMVREASRVGRAAISPDFFFNLSAQIRVDAADRHRARLTSAFWKSEDDIGAMPGLGGEVDTHPYVSFTLNIS